MIKSIFSNWSKSSYWIYALGLISIIIATIISGPINIVSILSIIGGTFGLLSVVLIVNDSKYSGYIGTVSAIIYIYLSISAKNPSDAVLNILFMITLNIPLIISKKWQNGSKTIDIKGNYAAWRAIAGIFLSVFMLLYLMEIYITKTPRPFESSLAASMGITAAIMTSLRINQSFILWSCQNVFQLVLYTTTFIHGDAPITLAITYLFYSINASTAFFSEKWGYKK